LRCRRYDGTARKPQAAAKKTRNNAMLAAMRRGVANLLVKVLLGLLIFALALWGIGDYIVRGPQRGGMLASVGKTSISLEDYKQAYTIEMQVITAKLGRAPTPEQAQLIPLFTLRRLIDDAAIELHARELGITVADELVGRVIKGSNPEIVTKDGKIDMNKYIEIIRQSGARSVGEYELHQKRALTRQQLTETVGAGLAPQQFLIDALYRFRNETRVIEYVAADFSKLVAVAEPAEDKLKAFYERNKGKYKALEERKASLLLVSRDMAMQRVKVTDEEVKAAYDAAKDTYNLPEKRRVMQLTFPDKAAAEKGYTELSKAKDDKAFNEAAAKLGFSASDMQLGSGPLTKTEMIDPKIAEAAFALKKDELSRPVEGQFSVVLLRIPEIAAAKTRTFDDVKGEIRDKLASDRVGQQLQGLHEKIEAGRTKGTPLKEIAAEVKLPVLELAGLTRTGKSADGKVLIAHADAPKIAEAVFAATPGVETEIIELSDGGFAWFELLDVTPERQRTFTEVTAQVKASLMEEERRDAIAALVAKHLAERKPGEGLERVAKALNAKVERTSPLKRTDAPPAGLTASAMKQAFEMAKGDARPAATADGKSTIAFRVAEIVAAPEAKAEQMAAIKTDLAKQIREDLIIQYVDGLRARFGAKVNEKMLAEALGKKTSEN
jgi:peptidyl-prolyl cis-trans isomerase D